MTWHRWRTPQRIWLGGNCALFAAWSVARLVPNPVVGDVFTGASVAAILASVAFGLMLLAPACHWLRATVIALPVLTSGLRLVSLILDHPWHWPGIAFALLLAFVYSTAGPAMMPPPISNGCAKKLIEDNHG
jgi:hypothetical protein